MGKQYSLFPPTVEELHKQVAKELGRVKGEDWEDFNEVVRYEVNARIKENAKPDRYPDYLHSKIIIKKK